ncbi:MAG: OmpH family outer membrane protein [Gemmatimonadota bacterium]
MIRWHILSVAGMLLLAPAVASAQQSDLRVAYVDSEAIIKEAPGYTEANEEFNQVAGLWRDSLETKRAQLQGLFEEYQKQEVILSPESKAERQQEILQLENEIQQYFQSKFGPEGEAGQRQAELMQPIIERVNNAIDETRREGGYSLIFDLNDGALVAGDPSLNITDEVIQRLQASGAAPAPSR